MKQNRPDHLSLVKKLQLLNNSIERSPVKMDAGKKRFLQQATKLRSEKTVPQRQKFFAVGNPGIFGLPKKRSGLANALITFLFIILFMTGGAVTFVAAKSSQPGTPLYPARIIQEELQLAFEQDMATKTQLSLDFSFTRANELEQFLKQDKLPSQKMISRFENQVTRTIHFALQQKDADAIEALGQLKTGLQQFDLLMKKMEITKQPNFLEAINQIRLINQERIYWATLGIENPAQIKAMVELNYRQRNREVGITPKSTGTTNISATNTKFLQSTKTPHSTPTWSATHTPQAPGPNPSASPENTPQGPGPYPTAQKTKTPQGPGATPTEKGSSTPHGPGPKNP